VAKRGSYDENWVFNDVRLMLLGLVLLFLGAAHVIFLWALLALVAVLLARAAARAVQRRRRWREQPPGEFWADRL
jgi:Na+-transporting methylmalonyl-CoA/oxaloacetate decarboxylase gamma subunit